MNGHCVDCLHWDEDKVDERGYSECQRVAHQESQKVGVRDERGIVCLKLLTTGDSGCDFFEPKLAHPRSTP